MARVVITLQQQFESAVRRGHVPVVDAFLRTNAADPAACANWAVRWAAKHGRLGVVRRLLADARVDPTAIGNWAVRWAARNGHAAVVDELLRWRRRGGVSSSSSSAVDPAACHNYAVRCAAINGHARVVARLMRDARVNPADNDNEAIRWAARNGHLAVVEQLLRDPRVDPAARNDQPLRWAAGNGHLPVVLVLRARLAARTPTRARGWARRHSTVSSAPISSSSSSHQTRTSRSGWSSRQPAVADDDLPLQTVLLNSFFDAGPPRPGPGSDEDRFLDRKRRVVLQTELRYSNGCPICLEDDETDADRVYAACGHMYHRECLDEFLHYSCVCAVCKRDMCGGGSI